MIVYTAHYRYAGGDRIDVTLKGNHPEFKVFAPNGRLLGWGLRMRRDGERRLANAKMAHASARPREVAAAEAYQDWAWLAYAARYEEAMRVSYKDFRGHWDRMLVRETATLVCFCPNHERCHRRLLAEMFIKLGADDGGEHQLGEDGLPIET